MIDRPMPQPGILKIAPYVPGKSQAAPGVVAIKLSANESPLGASPAALAALTEASRSPEIYPEGTSRVLREALGEVHGLDPDRIVCGNGSDDLLHLLAQCYLGEGDEAVMSRHGFNVYPIVTMGASAEIVMAPERDYRADVDALLGAVTPRTKMLFLANPNNPTGTYLGGEELERLRAGLRPDILFVLDSAYAEYVTSEDYDVGISLVNRAENVVMVRTFSKMGLAGSRIGWMYAPAHVVDVVNRIRGPFNVNRPAQFAGAAAARDTGFTEMLRAYNARWRDWLTRALSGNAIRVVPSEANFVLALFADAETSKAAFQALFDEGLIVREIGVYGIDNGLRISIGPEPAMRRLVEVLRAFGAPGARD
ncbi:MAG: histidinol-phosphate transaminase [Devosia nanyangense]|uniref:Histidinol-phosphate aminotransferase n=1 Tax=Devosia nanyangense TaxID=1228055 RepID=A0A933L691_9HYPH|nr:histidinol-phosphate transaminase [Devosia nanyangense]